MMQNQMSSHCLSLMAGMKPIVFKICVKLLCTNEGSKKGGDLGKAVVR